MAVDRRILVCGANRPRHSFGPFSAVRSGQFAGQFGPFARFAQAPANLYCARPFDSGNPARREEKSQPSAIGWVFDQEWQKGSVLNIEPLLPLVSDEATIDGAVKTRPVCKA